MWEAVRSVAMKFRQLGLHLTRVCMKLVRMLKTTHQCYNNELNSPTWQQKDLVSAQNSSDKHFPPLQILSPAKNYRFAHHWIRRANHTNSCTNHKRKHARAGHSSPWHSRGNWSSWIEQLAYHFDSGWWGSVWRKEVSQILEMVVQFSIISRSFASPECARLFIENVYGTGSHLSPLPHQHAS